MARWFHDRHPGRGIPSVSLRRLLPEARFVGCADLEVSGCTADSRRLHPGQVFVAVRGETHDGHEFVAKALERGAAGVVVEHACPEAGRLQVVVPDSRAALARLFQALAGDPSETLTTFGVTGTAGRTAAAVFARSVFAATGARFGLVGRLGWSDGREARAVGVGSEEARGVAEMLAAMVEAGCGGAVLEFGYEAIGRRAAEGIAFDAVAVTDLGGGPGLWPDEVIARRTASARLVRRVAPGGAVVVNADDPHAELLGAVNLDARRVSFGLLAPADVSVRIDRLDRDGSRIRLLGFDREVCLTLRVPGVRAVSQALAAAALAWSQGVDGGAVAEGLEAVSELPGRLDAVDEGQPFAVFVDAATLGHDLQDALESLRSITPEPGKIHCVLGAEGLRPGGNRERLRLAAVAEGLADRVTLTTNNPRTEDPERIIDDLLAGLERPGRVRVEPDRALAIEAALADARPGDAVLIAGKGRASLQILADRAEPFDDDAAARRWLRNRRFETRRSA